MAKLKYLLIVLFTGLYFTSCSNTQTSQSWSQSMRGMANAYDKLLPFMYDSQRYSDPNNKKFISTYLKQLDNNAAGLSKHTGKGLSGDDPLFTVGLKGLKSIIQKASESYYVESYDYSQNLLQASVNYCNTCHSRTALGPTFMKWDQFSKLTKLPKPIDQAKMLVATRQFPKAAQELESSLNAGKIKNKQEQEEAIKRLMVVYIKNMVSPEKALKSLNALNSNSIPKSMKAEVKQWKKYLKDWTRGVYKNNENGRDLLGRLARRKRKAHFVSALHESLILHKSLSSEKNRAWRAKTYAALGRIYENNASLGFWNLPETYYETCIYAHPGSKTAVRCYYDLEKRIKKEAVGPNASALYQLEKNKLQKLKNIANKKPSKPSQSVGGSGNDDW